MSLYFTSPNVFTSCFIHYPQGNSANILQKVSTAVLISSEFVEDLAEEMMVEGMMNEEMMDEENGLENQVHYCL